MRIIDRIEPVWNRGGSLVDDMIARSMTLNELTHKF